MYSLLKYITENLEFIYKESWTFTVETVIIIERSK